jgi:hypothetical protein
MRNYHRPQKGRLSETAQKCPTPPIRGHRLHFASPRGCGRPCMGARSVRCSPLLFWACASRRTKSQMDSARGRFARNRLSRRRRKMDKALITFYLCVVVVFLSACGQQESERAAATPSTTPAGPKQTPKPSDTAKPAMTTDSLKPAVLSGIERKAESRLENRIHPSSDCTGSA